MKFGMNGLQYLAMAGCVIFQCSCYAALVLLITTVLSFNSDDNELTINGSLFITIGLNVKQFSGRNSTFPRHRYGCVGEAS
jgi:hypothetical protein